MDNTAGKIGFVQIAMVMMLFNGLASHVIINPLLLDASGRDAWIAVLLTAVLFIPWCALPVYIMKKSGRKPLPAWLAERTNRFVSWMLLVPVLIQLYLIGSMTVAQTAIWTITNYLPSAPQTIIAACLVLACHYSARGGLNTIAVGSGVLLPVVVCLGLFVATANVTEKNLALLKPLLENGWKPVASGMVYAGGAFVEVMLIVLLQHRLKKEVRTWQMMLLGVLLVWITLGPIVGAISEFGPREAAKQMVSPYEQWRLVKLGNYFEHVDFLSVFQWLAGASVRISLAQFLFVELLPVRSPQTRNRILLGVSLSFIAVSLATGTYQVYFVRAFEQYFRISLVVTLIVTTVWAAIAFFAKPANAKEEST